MYTKADFGKGLEEKLNTTTDIVELSRWAHREYLENCKDFEDGLMEIVMQIVAMEEGPEFEFSISQLRDLAQSLRR